MSLLELKLTILEDSLRKHEDRWRSEYIRANWPFGPFLKALETKGKMPTLHGVGTRMKGGQNGRI